MLEWQTWIGALYDRLYLRAWNVPVSSADAECERAPNTYRPITNCCVLADSLSEESVKELCSAAWNGNLHVDLKAVTVRKFTTSLQLSELNKILLIDDGEWLFQ